MDDITYVNSISAGDFNRLRKAVGWSEVAPAQARTGIDRTEYLVAAVHKGETVGMARLISDGGYVAFIADVIVLPEYQGRGIGKTMMGMISGHIRSGLKEGERVFVNLMSATGKQDFYKKLGFTERPSEALGPGMSMWIDG
jgi:GNAT superfamily N-acetyltransferase